MTSAGTSSRNRLKVIARRVMMQRGLLPNFSPAALAETNAMTKAATEAGASIRGLRGLLWCSIDNDDSRDLDQLSVAELMAGDTVKILVAVADVDALVKADSAVDAHAKANTTSVYTAAEIFPMLPERLSTDLTSLGESELAASLGHSDTCGQAPLPHVPEYRAETGLPAAGEPASSPRQGLPLTSHNPRVGDS